LLAVTSASVATHQEFWIEPLGRPKERLASTAPEALSKVTATHRSLPSAGTTS
jgi:hypothetical protein